MENQTEGLTVPTAPAPEPAGAAPAAAPAAVEPVAAEPVAAEPVAAPEPAATWPSADEYGWDEWDGKGESLPEEVRGWYGKFNDRHTKASEEYQTQLAAAEKNAQGWQGMYNAVFDGSEDPRVAQSAAELARTSQEFAEYRAEQEAREAQFNAYVDKESARYFEHITGKYPNLMDRLEGTEGADDIVLGLSEGVEFEDALLIWDRGPDAVAFAQQAIKDGLGEQYVKDLVALKFPKASEATAPAARSQPRASDLVTGSAPVTKPVVPAPVVEAPRNAQDRRMQAAMRAINAYKKR